MIILLCVNDRNNHNIVINVSSIRKLDDSIKLNLDIIKKKCFNGDGILAMVYFKLP